jgi:hypothetical protein
MIVERPRESVASGSSLMIVRSVRGIRDFDAAVMRMESRPAGYPWVVRAREPER